MVALVNLLFAKRCNIFAGQKHRTSRLKFPEVMNKLKSFILDMVLEGESCVEAIEDPSKAPISRKNPPFYSEEPLTALQSRCQNCKHLN